LSATARVNRALVRDERKSNTETNHDASGLVAASYCGVTTYIEAGER